MPTLKRLREEALLSSTELARLVGVSYHTVYEWEHAMARPSPANQRKLVVALNITPTVLLQAIEETRKEAKGDRAAA
jgi:DNA-binding transcriptional regulator YiaG